MPQDDGPAHRPATGDDPAIPHLAHRLHGRFEVGDLAVTERGVPGRPAVPAEVERQHAGMLRDGGTDGKDARLVDGAGEAVRDDHADVERVLRRCVDHDPREMSRREPFAVRGEEGHLLGGGDEGRARHGGFLRAEHDAILSGNSPPGSVAQL